MGAIRRTKVALRIRGDDLDPEVVSAALCCRPTSGGRKGDEQALGRGRTRPSPVGFWHLTMPRREPGDLDGQIAELLAAMTDDGAVWQHLTDRYAADLFCGLFLEEANEGLSLSPPILLALGLRNIVLDFDIYAPS